MKKLSVIYLIALSLFIFFIGFKAFASDSLPASFQCQSDTDTLITFNPSNVFIGYFSCSGVPFSLAIHGSGVYSIVECDPSLGDCNITDYQTLISSTQYVNNISYEWSSIPVGSCPSNVICYQDWLLMNMVIIFFLSMMCMGLFINFFKNKK